MLRLKGMVVVLVVLAAMLSQVATRADEATTQKVVAGLMVLNALRGTSDSELLQIGRQLDEGLVRQYGTTTNGLARAQRVVARLEPHTAKRPEVKVLNSAEVNAMAVPGHVYVTSALLSQANDDQFAGVMGHELSHIEAGHCRRAINRARIAQGVGGVLYLANANQSIATGVSLLALATIFDYSRGEEYEADKLGAERASQAGYSHDGLASFLERSEGNSDRANQLLSSHPRTDRRVTALREGNAGSVRATSAGTVRGSVVEKFSVSFTGMNSEQFSQGFLLLADHEGQPVDVLDSGGDYPIQLNGDQRDLPLGVNVSTSGRDGYVNTGVTDRMTWVLVADIYQGNRRLTPESASASGWRGYLHAGKFTSHGAVTLDFYNSYLGESLQGQAVRGLVPIVLHRLQEQERLRVANQPREATGDGSVEPAATYRYILMLNREVPVALSRSLSNDSPIGIYRGSHQIGSLKVDWFNNDHTKVWVSGDTGVAQQKGVTFKSL